MKIPCFEDAEFARECKAVAMKHGLDILVLRELCLTVARHAGSGRREGINAEINEAIDKFLERMQSGAAAEASSGESESVAVTTRTHQSSRTPQE